METNVLRTNDKVSAVALRLGRPALLRLSMAELAVVMDAVTAARDAINGVNNQPRCVDGADDVLDKMQDGLNEWLSLILDLAEDSKPLTAGEAKQRAYIILHHATWAKEDLDFFEEVFQRVKTETAQFVKVCDHE